MKKALVKGKVVVFTIVTTVRAYDRLETRVFYFGQSDLKLYLGVTKVSKEENLTIYTLVSCSVVLLGRWSHKKEP